MMKTYKILLSFFLILISGFGFSQSVPSYVPTNGLVGWWGFNGNAQDGSGNGNHGTVNGATLTTDRFGNQNSAYDFDGVNDYVDLGDMSAYIDNLGQFTLSYWVNSDLLFYGSNKGVFAHWANHSSGVYPIGIQSGISPQGKIEIFVIGGQGTASSFQLNPNQSYNVIVTFNGSLPLSERFKLYINGNFQEFVNLSPSTGNFGNIANQTAIGGYVGPSPNGVYSRFNGKLDDIGIWNRALTQQEITILYNAQSGITLPTQTSCLGDTTSVTISHPGLTGVANASLRMTYNPDSLTYVGFNSLNPAFNGMTISGGNGSVLMDWNTSSNQTIAAGNMVNLRFRVNGNSNLNWDTTTIPCEFSDVNFNAIPQTYVSGSLTQNTRRFTWNRNICEGQSFSLSGQSYTTSGTYQGRRFGTGGACDTLITLNLNVIPTQTILPAVTICSNQPYFFNGLSLSTSGTYLDTLVNSLGCDSILQLNLTVNPAYNQNQNVVICTGTTYSFGGQNLTASGTYSHTYTTANGCDSLVQLNLSVADSVSIQSTNGSNGFCPGGSLRIGLVSPIPNVSYQWTKDGSIITGTNSDSLVVSQSGVYQLTVQVSPTCSIASNPLTISVLNCNRITGDLKYDNINQTPLAGVPVHLKTLLGNMVASDTTDSAGVYEITGYNNGNYVLDANVNYSWGGVNSTDALQVTRFFTSLITLSPLRVKAGDVNGNNFTNSADALLINRRITGLLSAFGVGGFVNSLPSVNAAGNPLQGNLRVLSTGDVNGTYNPLPLAPALVLDTVYGNGNVGTAVVRFTTAGSGVFERGIVWGSSPNPTLTSNKSIAGTGGFGFTHSFSSIDPNNIQYARAYARTSAGVYYSQERSFTPIPGLRCPGTPSVTDIDGNLYHTVQIGNQCWTQSNLKTSRYRNGDNISTGLSNSDWASTMAGAYSIYNNDPVNDGLYGKLYNHYAVTDSRGLCPTGWHVPSDAEWTTLENQLGGSSVAGGALKSTAIQPTPGGWNSPNTGATNSSGFNALPSGRRAFNGSIDGMSSNGYWWSTLVTSGSSALYRYLSYNNNFVVSYNFESASGFSVRCLKNFPQVNTISVTNVTSSTAMVTGEVISEGGQNTTRGFCYSTTSNPTVSNATTMNGTGLGVYSGTLMNLTPSTTYYARAYATNSLGTAYGSVVNFTTDSLPGLRCPGTPSVTDIDGNLYHTVQIGNQCWTQSNLKVSKYRNGDTITTGLSNSAWVNTTSGAYAIYNNDPVNDGLYGKLYNHYAVMDGRGLCPTGWHVPTDGEWTTLENHLGGSSVAGGALKSTAIQPNPGGWNSPNTGATNSSGFSALACGNRSGPDGTYGAIYNNGIFGTSSKSSSNNYWTRNLYYLHVDVERNTNTLRGGTTIRCLKNTLPQVNTTSVTNVTPSTALVTGEVISVGDQNTARGFCYSTTSNPTVSNDTTMNGTGLGVYTGTLQNLTPSTTYYVRAYATNSVGTSYGNEVNFTTDSLPGVRCPGAPNITDIDGNIYNTVQIGAQCWTQSNLKVSKYRNGDTIPTGLGNIDWGNTTSGAYAIYNNDPVNDGLYGKLYNWYAVNDSRGLCPTGWHVPSDGEWNVLVKFLDPSADTICGNCISSGIAGGKMKSTATQPTPGGWIAPNSDATNSSGFTGLPGGSRDSGGGFANLGPDGGWWSSSVAGSGFAWSRGLGYYYAGATRYYFHHRFGFSVRCVKDSLSGGGSASLSSVSTTSATSITSTGATTGGNVTSDGGASVTARGVAYGTVQNPTTANSTTSNGTGTGAFTSTLSGLTASTLYYVRAYATNAVGTAYGSQVSLTTSAPQPCPGTPTVTDVDNNTYNTVQIGTQCWTQSNLKVSKYRNGDNIPTGLSNSDWENSTSGAYAIYNNDPVNDGLYGKLYNHYAVTDSRGLCPTGWHVPSDAEWTTLENQLGGSNVAGGALKSTATQPTPGGWASPNTGATNSSGFTALPGGLRYSFGDFNGVSGYGYWWSSSVSSGSFALNRNLYYDLSNFYRFNFYLTFGFSVRCLNDSSRSLPTVSTTSVTGITSTGATTGGNVTSDGGASVTARGVAYDTAQNPTTANNITFDGTGTGVFTSTLSGLTSLTLYNVRAYATNAVGTAYGNQVSFTTTSTAFSEDFNTVASTTSVPSGWVLVNMDGRPGASNVSALTGNSTNAWTFPAVFSNLGKSAVSVSWTNPVGIVDRWLISPSISIPASGNYFMIYEAQSLGNASYPEAYELRISNGDTARASFLTSAPLFSTNGENTALTVRGFSMAPYLGQTIRFAFRNISNDMVAMLVDNIRITVPAADAAQMISHSVPSLAFTNNSVTVGGSFRNLGLSNITSATLNYQVNSGPTTSQAYSGSVSSFNADAFTFTSTYTPTTAGAYSIKVWVSGLNGGNVNSDTLTANLSILNNPNPVACPGTPTVTDVDNNTYNTVQIGTQCWTQSNLKVSKYRNGDNIPTGLSNSSWQNTTSGAYAIYNNDPVNDGLYGKLYNHYAVTDSRGLCPTGWHVPSDGEWNILVKYLDPNADTVSGVGPGSTAGGALKNIPTQPTAGGWNSPNMGATNSSGFTALPGGLRFSNGFFTNVSNGGYWWSSSVSSASVAWNRSLSNNSSYIYRINDYRNYGFSVRCCRD